MAKSAKERLLEAQERMKKEQEKIAALEKQVKEETEKSFNKSRKILDSVIKDCIDRGIDAKVLEEKMEDLQRGIAEMDPDAANREIGPDPEITETKHPDNDVVTEPVAQVNTDAAVIDDES